MLSKQRNTSCEVQYYLLFKSLTRMIVSSSPHTASQPYVALSKPDYSRHMSALHISGTDSSLKCSLLAPKVAVIHQLAPFQIIRIHIIYHFYHSCTIRFRASSLRDLPPPSYPRLLLTSHHLPTYQRNRVPPPAYLDSLPEQAKQANYKPPGTNLRPMWRGAGWESLTSVTR